MAVQLDRVTKIFGAVRAVVDVSARFDPGVTVVEGPNGSGKSTLLGIVATLVRPTLGKVSHGELGATREQVRARMGWVGHAALCYADLTGRENVELAARLNGRDAPQAFRRAQERFGLGAFATRPVRTYSRGQRQRVALARALVHEPVLLLLDEPSTGLDAQGVEVLVGVVREEARRGCTIVVITHDAKFASVLGGRRMRMARGRLSPAEDPV